MAHFCRTLWHAAGRDSRQYDDMAIELGQSRHCYVYVNELIDVAFARNFEACEMTYLDVDKHCKTKEHGDRLMNCFLSLLGEMSNVIAHQSGLEKLGVGHDAARKLGFEPLRGPDGSSEWYVREADVCK